MTPRVRKLALTAHVTSSVGWLGAVAAFLALAVASLASDEAETVRAAHLGMEVIGRFVLAPLALASLLTGLVQSLGTKWGVFPTLLGPREAPDQRHRHDRLAAVHADARALRRAGGRDGVRH